MDRGRCLNHSTRLAGEPLRYSAKAEKPFRCKLGLHSWRGGRRANTNPDPFDISPVVGTRTCAGCGKRQRFSYDSQGGCWVTIK